MGGKVALFGAGSSGRSSLPRGKVRGGGHDICSLSDAPTIDGSGGLVPVPAIPLGVGRFGAGGQRRYLFGVFCKMPAE